MIFLKNNTISNRKLLPYEKLAFKSNTFLVILVKSRLDSTQFCVNVAEINLAGLESSKENKKDELN